MHAAKRHLGPIKHVSNEIIVSDEITGSEKQVPRVYVGGAVAGCKQRSEQKLYMKCIWFAVTPCLCLLIEWST